MTKKTIRRFTFLVPNGVALQKIRTFIRAADGTEYPVDQEIEVPTFTDKVVEYTGELDIQSVTEEFALSKESLGTKCVACQDFVELID